MGHIKPQWIIVILIVILSGGFWYYQKSNPLYKFGERRQGRSLTSSDSSHNSPVQEARLSSKKVKTKGPQKYPNIGRSMRPAKKHKKTLEKTLSHRQKILRKNKNSLINPNSKAAKAYKSFGKKDKKEYHKIKKSNKFRESIKNKSAQRRPMNKNIRKLNLYHFEEPADPYRINSSANKKKNVKKRQIKEKSKGLIFSREAGHTSEPDYTQFKERNRGAKSHCREKRKSKNSVNNSLFYRSGVVTIFCSHF